MTNSDTFSHGTHFEERLIQALLIDHAFAEQMMEVINVDYFTLNHLKQIARHIYSFYEKYKNFPSIPLLEGILNDEIKSEIIQSQVVKYFKKIHSEPLNGDIEFVKEESLEFCRKQKLLLALETCLDLTASRNFDQIVNEIQKAVMAGAERDTGHVYEDKLEERMSEARRTPVATPWLPINAITSGGVSAGELAVILSLTGVGKSHALVDIGAAAVMAGKTVVHFTFELSEIGTGKRYDSRFSGIEFDELKNNKEFIEECVNKLNGKVRIKKYPNRKASIQTIRTYLNKLKMEDFIPDLVIIDYADIMKSSKHYENKRFEEEAVYEELRSLADELNVPIWTAAQTNRSGMDVEVLTLKHIAECFSKSMVADLFITMNRKKTGAYETLGNFFVAKSRLGADGIKFNTVVNTALSKILCLEPHSTQEKQVLMQYDLALESDEDRIKKKLKTMQTKELTHLQSMEENN